MERSGIPKIGKRPFCLVRGVSEGKLDRKKWANIEIHDVLTAADLNQKIMESEAVICRSGYSSLMDLVALQKKAILIPTIGQTEQEYLAAELARQNRFICAEQDTLDLEKSLAQLPKTVGFADFLQEDARKNETLQQVVRELLEF
jgi:UDP-N-acetylglucosamine:LPS N-acetylglucosamine transferase